MEEMKIPLNEVVKEAFDTMKVLIDKYGLGLSRYQNQIKQLALEGISKDGFSHEIDVNDIPKIFNKFVEAPILYTEQKRMPFNIQGYREETNDAGYAWNKEAKRLGISIY